jgi:hypothetical protein
LQKQESIAISSLTKMKIDSWREWMAKRFQQEFPNDAKEILNAIQYGIPVDFIGDRTKPVNGVNRMENLTPEMIDKVTAVIQADVKALKKAGPFEKPPFDYFFVSPIGAVPKKEAGKIRVIHNLSYPFGGESVNSGIRVVDMRLESFDKAADAVSRLGRNCLLIKLDVEAAYKQVPVRREDWHLLGFKWLDLFYYERVLPFGLRSSCRLWDLFATVLHYFFVKHLGIKIVVHYVDDFLFVVSLPMHLAKDKLDEALRLCDELGIPMAADKTEGPTSALVFLGIHLDAANMRASLPHQRLEDLKQLAALWVKKKERATIHELQSLTGILNFACKVVRPGRYYLRRIINHTSRMLRTLKNPGSWAAWLIPPAVKEDIQWWLDFADKWNGISLLYEADWHESNSTNSTLELETDACGTGFGAVYKGEWFAGTWSAEQLKVAHRVKHISMPYLELHTLVQAAATWGHQWSRRKVRFLTDAEVNVQAILAKDSKDPHSMHLLRQLCTIAAKHGFDFQCSHIPGLTNVAADALSRHGDCSVFRTARPQADATATAIVPITLA